MNLSGVGEKEQGQEMIFKLRVEIQRWTESSQTSASSNLILIIVFQDKEVASPKRRQALTPLEVSAH
ncbi:MAG: hypothetical protein ACFB4I_10330 [Cyanophyceae cyanobacterium]